jgi:hypothetical protein
MSPSSRSMSAMMSAHDAPAAHASTMPAGEVGGGGGGVGVGVSKGVAGGGHDVGPRRARGPRFDDAFGREEGGGGVWGARRGRRRGGAPARHHAAAAPYRPPRESSALLLPPNPSPKRLPPPPTGKAQVDQQRLVPADHARRRLRLEQRLAAGLERVDGVEHLQGHLGRGGGGRGGGEGRRLGSSLSGRRRARNHAPTPPPTPPPPPHLVGRPNGHRPPDDLRRDEGADVGRELGAGEGHRRGVGQRDRHPQLVLALWGGAG